MPIIISDSDTITDSSGRPLNTIDERARLLKTDALPVFDLDAMGVKAGQTIAVDTTELRDALSQGFVKLKYTNGGNEYTWVTSGMKVVYTERTYYFISGIFNGGLVVYLYVYDDAIELKGGVLNVTTA